MDRREARQQLVDHQLGGVLECFREGVRVDVLALVRQVENQRQPVDGLVGQGGTVTGADGRHMVEVDTGLATVQQLAHELVGSRGGHEVGTQA